VSDESFTRTALGSLRVGISSTSSDRSGSTTGSAATSSSHVDVRRDRRSGSHLQVRVATTTCCGTSSRRLDHVDGISLTIVKVLDDGFTVAVIPAHDCGHDARDEGAGDPVNSRST